jgi:hypothetical protein
MKERVFHKIAYMTHKDSGYMAMPFGLLKEVCTGVILMTFLSASKTHLDNLRVVLV